MSQDPAGPVRPGHQFDEVKLAAYLRGRLPQLTGELVVRQFRGGQSNPTFLLASGDRRWVLRKRPPGKLLPSAHLVEREFRVMSALSATDVPVPRVHLLCTDEEVIGTSFFVMDFLDGRILRDPALAELPRGRRADIYRALAATLAKLHRVDCAAVGLGDFGKPGDYFARQIVRWAGQYRASRTAEIPAMDFLIEWLPLHLPGDLSSCLVHGDYRLDNLVFDRDSARVLGVLDWELSTIGHPLADLAYACLAYRLPPGKLVLSGIAGLDLAVASIPDEQDFVAAYCADAGRGAVENWPFYLAFALFRVAAIAQGIAARALQGNASAPDAGDVGALARDLAERGARIARGE